MFWFHVYLTENFANIPWPCLLQEETLKFRRFAAKVCGWSRHYIFFPNLRAPRSRILEVAARFVCCPCLHHVFFGTPCPPPLLPCLSIEEESDPEISRIYFNIHEWSQANHVQRVSQAVWLYLQYMFAFAREITIKIVPLQIQFCSMWCAQKHVAVRSMDPRISSLFLRYFLGGVTFHRSSASSTSLPFIQELHRFSFGKACRPAWQRTLNLILSNFSCKLPSRLP